MKIAMSQLCMQSVHMCLYCTVLNFYVQLQYVWFDSTNNYHKNETDADPYHMEEEK